MAEPNSAQTCETCDALCRPGWLTAQSGMHGQCRRWSPHPTVGIIAFDVERHIADNRVNWPITHILDWCLEWSPKRGTTVGEAKP